jgi:hypothetical protein
MKKNARQSTQLFPSHMSHREIKMLICQEKKIMKIKNVRAKTQNKNRKIIK